MNTIKMVVYGLEGTVLYADRDITRVDLDNYINADIFQTMIGDMLADDKKVAILAFCSREQVFEHLKLLFPDRVDRIEVVVSSDFGLDPKSKAEVRWNVDLIDVHRYRDGEPMAGRDRMLLDLIDRHELDPSQVLFFDSNPWYLEKAKVQGFANVVYCPEGLEMP